MVSPTSTWTNESFGATICNAISGAVSLQINPVDSLYFLLPDCVYSTTSLTSLIASQVILSNSASETDPLSRLPQLATLSLIRAKWIINGVEDVYSPAWSTFFGRQNFLSTLSLASSSLSGSLPLSLPAGLATFEVPSNFLTGTIPATLVSASPAALRVSLRDNRLTGLIPAGLFASQVGAAPFQTFYLDVSGNQLGNNQLNQALFAAQRIASVSSLYLDFSRNRFLGLIPRFQTTSTALNAVHLNFSNNGFSGTIDSNYVHATSATGLSYLFFDVSNNGLSGTAPTFPATISATTILSNTFLDFSNNVMVALPSTSIGPDAGSIIGNFVYLANVNRISGYFPASLFSSVRVTPTLFTFSVANNSLGGVLPATLFPTANYASFTSLSLSFASNGLLGTISPTFLPTATPLLAQLSLNLSSNHFTGIVPNNLFTYFTVSSTVPDRALSIDFSDNEFTGPLPANFVGTVKTVVARFDRCAFNSAYAYGDLFRNTDQLTSIYLSASENQLTGNVEIPQSSATILYLYLDLSRNLLNSLSISNTYNGYLNYFDVSNNTGLTGSIPSSLVTSSARITHLDASDTRLTGPLHLADNAFIQSLDLSNTLIDFCPLPSPARPWVAPNLVFCNLDYDGASRCGGRYPAVCQRNLNVTVVEIVWNPLSNWTDATLVSKCSELPVNDFFSLTINPSPNGAYFRFPTCAWGDIRPWQLFALNGHNLIFEGNATSPGDPFANMPAFTRRLSLWNPRINRTDVNLAWPAFFDKFTLLTQVSLRNAGLIGSLPESLPTTLHIFEVPNNNLIGTISPILLANVNTDALPPSFFLPDYIIDLSGNDLEGVIPAPFAVASPNPIKAHHIAQLTLNLSSNRLTGTYPSQLFPPTYPLANASAISLDLSNNRLSSAMPSTIIPFTSIYLKSFYFNISHNALTGGLSASMFGSPLLANESFVFDASHNAFTSSVSPFLAAIPVEGFVLSAKVFLNNNGFTGSVPIIAPRAGAFVGSVELRLDSNRLSGSVASNALGSSKMNPATLKANFENNTLTGLPATLFPANTPAALSNLWVSFARNSISGTLSSRLISRLPALVNVSINLSANRLSRLANPLLGTYTVESTVPSRVLEFNITDSVTPLGSLPTQIIGSLKSLVLNADRSGISGQYPFGDLFVNASTSGIQVLNLSLSSNNITGELLLRGSLNDFPLHLNLAQNNLERLVSDPTIAYGRSIDISGNHELEGAVPKAFFLPGSKMQLFNASNTQLKGSFPDIGGYITNPLSTLDLSGTEVNFCSLRVLPWTAPNLQNCRLLNTTAFNCDYLYPTQCQVSAVTVPTPAPVPIDAPVSSPIEAPIVPIVPIAEPTTPNSVPSNSTPDAIPPLPTNAPGAPTTGNVGTPNAASSTVLSPFMIIVACLLVLLTPLTL